MCQLSRKCWRRTDSYKRKTPLIHSRHSCTCLYWISIWKMFLKVLRYDWQLQTKKTLCHSRPRFRCLTKWITIREWKCQQKHKLGTMAMFLRLKLKISIQRTIIKPSYRGYLKVSTFYSYFVLAKYWAAGDWKVNASQSKPFKTLVAYLLHGTNNPRLSL